MVGIDTKNKTILDKKYICSACSLILRDPIQLSACGHRQCHSCFDIQEGMTIKCSQCQTEIRRNQVMIDRGFKSDMQSLPIDCSFCHWTGVLKKYQSHLDQFHSMSKCEYYSEESDSMNTINEDKVSQCQRLTVDCLLKDFGCHEQIIRGKMADHYFTIEHQESLLQAVQQIKSQLLGTQIDNDLPLTTTAAATDSATAHFQELYETLNILPDGLETLNNDVYRLNNEPLQCQIKLQTL